jgi:DNA topoisomerase-1
LNCKICNREASKNNYCELHMKAYESIVKKYKHWKRALKVSWKEYLSEIVKNPLTGEWAKEVAEHLSKTGEKQNVTNS